MVNELNDMFYERCWKVINLYPKTEKELNEAIKLSKIWIYKKYFNCQYSDKLENKIKDIF